MELKTIGLFVITALAEIVGCYLPYLWLKEDKSIWLLVPAAISLALFAWLLSLHPTAAGRVYAAYGGVYIFMAIMWLWLVDGVKPRNADSMGSADVSHVRILATPANPTARVIVLEHLKPNLTFGTAQEQLPQVKCRQANALQTVVC